MKIAILGWGSLIWNPGNLGINKEQGKNGWFDDGPMLPVEFARISKDGRLTLVIVDKKEVESVQTLYGISKYTELDHAILDLAVREGCGKNKIGSYVKSEDEFVPDKFECKNEIKSWIDEKEDIDAVIWTNLPEKYWYLNDENEKIDVDKTKIIQYLDDLSSNKKALAEQYVRRTPVAVNTKMRQEIETKLEWSKIL